MPTGDLLQTISAALYGGSLFSGGLLRTHEASAVWRFTSQVPAQTLALFHREKARAVVTSDVIGMAAEWVCWVVAYQVGAIQHRWFLPLVGTQVASLLREVRETDLRLWMDAGAELPVFEARIPVSKELGSALQAQWRPCADAGAAAENLLRTAGQLLHAGALMPADGSELASRICVTAVIPADLPLDPPPEVAPAIWPTRRGAS